ADEVEWIDVLDELLRVLDDLAQEWPVGAVWPGSDERAPEANLEFHAERLRPVVKTLGEHGIRFGIEFVGAPSLRAPYSYEFVHDLPVALDLGVRTAEPNVGPLMDTWHLHTSAGTLDDIRRLPGEADRPLTREGRPARRPDRRARRHGEAAAGASWRRWARSASAAP